MNPELLIDDSEFLTPIYVSVQKFEEARHRRDAKGRFTEIASVTVGDHTVAVVKPRRAASDKLVPINVIAFDEAFQRERDLYLGVGGVPNAIHDRYPKFGEYFASHDSMEASEVTVNDDGRVGFTNGRHRYAWLRDQGLTSIPVAMTPESVVNAKKHGYLAVIKKAWDESQHPRDTKGQFAYTPSHDAPEAGEWDRGPNYDPNAMFGPEPKWRQQHRQLVVEALQSWVGDPSSFRIHAQDALEGAPMPSSGSGKQMRAQAEALLWELEHHAKSIPVTLYRGSGPTGDPIGNPFSWSEESRIAKSFAKRYGGRVDILPAGTARGLRLRDYTGDTFGEKQWIVRAGNDPLNTNVTREIRSESPENQQRTRAFLEQVQEAYRAAKKQEHDYGNTQIAIAPTSSAAASLNAARAAIWDDDCMGTGKDVDPNHLTVRYGLLNEDLDKLRTFIAKQTPFEARIIGIELFPASEHSDGAVPVVARIASPELRAIEKQIGYHADFKEKSFPVYKPHCTLAYCKPGSASKYLDLYVDGSFVVQSITISHSSGVQETIPFGMAQKWNPSQPRDEKGRFTDLGLYGGLVTVLHGTTRQNAEAILAEGFKTGNPARVAAQIEQEYGLPTDSILSHVAFQFAKGRRDLGRVHFTTDESVADQYSIPEVLQDALTSAHMLRYPTPDDVPFTKAMHAERKAWIDKEARRLTEPALLAVTVPFEVVGQHGFGKQFTLDEFKALLAKFPKAEEDIFNNITIPIEALQSATIQRWKRESHRSITFRNRPRWAPEKHPRQPAGSSHGGEFMATLHGPKDALDSLLNKERNISIQRDDVRRFLELADEQLEDPDLTDLQVEGMQIFGGNGLGIERDDMPQIPPEHRQRFLEYAEQQGIKITEETVDPLTLKPTQNAISARRVGKKLRQYEQGDRKFPSVLVSNANRILDGHHHWGMMAAFALEIPSAKMPIFRLHLSTKKALAVMLAYMRIHKLERATLSGAVAKADPVSGRYVTPFVSFDKQGDEQLRMIASLNSSRLATWGFTAEAEIRGMARYKLTAVLDGRTSKFCRLVDGHIFNVPDARKKVIEVLNVQDPEDLRVVQPWPKQTKAALAEFAQMSAAELTARGLHIPPYHPHCRTICRIIAGSKGEAMEAIPTLPADVESFQAVTMADLKELGIDATQEDVDQWNAHVGMTPVELLSKFSGQSPQEVMTKGKGVGSRPIRFDESGAIGFNVRGADPQGVEFKLGAILDPFTGTYYLTQAELLAGNPAAETVFLKQMFRALIDMGMQSTATSVAVGVAGNAAYYAKLGFLPDELEWDAIRLYALEGETMIPEVLASLAPEDALLVKQLLQDKSVSAMSALVELPFTYQGRTIGEWLFGEATGTWALDLTDDVLVAQARAYLS